MHAADNNNADAIQALLDAGADRFAEVRSETLLLVEPLEPLNTLHHVAVIPLPSFLEMFSPRVLLPIRILGC